MLISLEIWVYKNQILQVSRNKKWFGRATKLEEYKVLSLIWATLAVMNPRLLVNDPLKQPLQNLVAQVEP